MSIYHVQGYLATASVNPWQFWARFWRPNLGPDVGTISQQSTVTEFYLIIIIITISIIITITIVTICVYFRVAPTHSRYISATFFGWLVVSSLFAPKCIWCVRNNPLFIQKKTSRYSRSWKYEPMIPVNCHIRAWLDLGSVFFFCTLPGSLLQTHA